MECWISGSDTYRLLSLGYSKEYWTSYMVQNKNTAGSEIGKCDGISYSTRTVSYTHLDVYKRQGIEWEGD